MGGIVMLKRRAMTVEDFTSAALIGPTLLW